MGKFEHKYSNSLYSSNIFLFIFLKRTHTKLKEDKRKCVNSQKYGMCSLKKFKIDVFYLTKSTLHLQITLKEGICLFLGFKNFKVSLYPKRLTY